MKNSKPVQKKDTLRGVTTRRSFVIGFCFTAILFLICLTFFPVRYETNDDFGNIRLLTSLSGFEADSSSPVLSQFLGIALYSLYQIAPDIPWYGLTVYAAMFLGIFLMASIISRHCNVTALIICLPGLMIFFFHAIVLTNYTTAALLVELGSLLAWAEWVITGTCPARRPVAYAALLGAGLALSYMLRWELALRGIAFGIPVLFFIRKPMVKTIWPIALALFAFVAADRALYEYKQPETTRQYMEYNELRRVFHDTAKGEFYRDRTPAALAKTGWSQEDYVTYKRWILYDDALFNTEKLKTFLSANDPQMSASLIKMIPSRLSQNFLNHKAYSLIFLFTLGALILIYLPFLLRMSGKEATPCLLATGSVFSMIVFFAYYRFEPRIYLPLFCYALTLTLLILQVKTLPLQSADRGRLGAIFLTLAIIFAMVSYGKSYAKAKDILRLLDYSLQEKRYVAACLDEMKQRVPDTDPILIIMDPTNYLATQSVHPLKEMADYPAVKIMPAGTGVNSPRYERILQSLSLNRGRDFLKWAIGNDRVFFALMARGEKHQKHFVSLWESYYYRHITKGSKPGLKPVMDFRNRAGAGLILFEMIGKAI